MGHSSSLWRGIRATVPVFVGTPDVGSEPRARQRCYPCLPRIWRKIDSQKSLIKNGIFCWLLFLTKKKKMFLTLEKLMELIFLESSWKHYPSEADKL